MNLTYRRQADDLCPRLIHEERHPTREVELVKDRNAFQGWTTRTLTPISSVIGRVLRTGDEIILDMGEYVVGHVEVQLHIVGRPQDAPASLLFHFAEVPLELARDVSSYRGWISSSWHQRELLFLDSISAVVKLPRRYAFRYLRLQVIATSRNYSLVFDGLTVLTSTSADSTPPPLLGSKLDQRLITWDAIGIRTLRHCMQTVFEDGPKRDRRLWVGDLRLQAITNYQTFRNFDLVKRCLYLFAAVTKPDGQVPSDLFEGPDLVGDEIFFWDYSLLYSVTLCDYVEATGDSVTATELWSIAYRQVELFASNLTPAGLVPEEGLFCFIDWHERLDKQTSLLGVYLYCLGRMVHLASYLGDKEREIQLLEWLNTSTVAAKDHLWDSRRNVFVSGPKRQVSSASQIWMVLAGAIDQDQARAALEAARGPGNSVRPRTPYMIHHEVEAWCLMGDREKALEVMDACWGEMTRLGADTFWEVFDPRDHMLSPYDDCLINSHCHAWSCTPSYFARRYWNEK